MVRSDLTLQQQLVQSAHAALESGIHLPNDPYDISNLIVLSVASEQALLAEFERLKSLSLPVLLFREPDLADQATALATGALEGPDRKHLRHHKLWDGTTPESIQ